MLTKKLPIFATFLTLALLLSSYLCNQHDQERWDAIYDLYQGKLLEIETPIYLDYLSRRLNVEGLGSADKLASLQTAQAEGASEPLIKAMVSDASFANYLSQNGNLFLTSETLTFIQDKRIAVESFFDSISSQQMGISIENFAPGQILTHPFSVTYHPLSVLLIMSVSLLVFCFEAMVSRFQLYCYLLLSATTSASTYLLFAPEYASVYEGPLGLVYGLATALAIYIINKQGSLKSIMTFPGKQLLASLVLISAIVIYTILHMLKLDNLALHLGTSVIAPAMVCGLVMALSQKIYRSEKVPQKISGIHSTEWEYRAELSKAMDFLSRFEFNAARQVLNSLATQYPDSRAIMEQRYHLAKFQPEDQLYWKLAKSLIELCTEKQDYSRVCRLFSDIQKNTATKTRAQECLDPEHYHKMMMLFIRNNDVTRAEQAFLFLELAGDKHIIQDACQSLIQEFKARHTSAKQQQYEMLLERLKA